MRRCAGSPEKSRSSIQRHFAGFYTIYAHIARKHGLRVHVMASFTAAVRGFLTLICDNALQVPVGHNNKSE